MRILVTGACGYKGTVLVPKLLAAGHEVTALDTMWFGNFLEKTQVLYPGLTFIKGDVRDTDLIELSGYDAIIHLAGENRPQDLSAFEKVNSELTQLLCDCIRTSGRKIPLVLASSTQADQENPYGKSKLNAEQAVEMLASQTDNPTYIYRLPNVFGKWCKPNYNSVVATFCHNIAHNLPIQINDTSTTLKLIYVDDVVSAFLKVIQKTSQGVTRLSIEPEYSTSF